MTVFTYESTVLSDWIDYNGHMQDAYYGLIFSHAVDAFQDAVGFDAAYRARTGCTIYLLEDHKFFLREVKEAARVCVQTRLLAFDEKKFHLHQLMYEGLVAVAASEVMELHVKQAPAPHAVPIPKPIAEVLDRNLCPPESLPDPAPRSRALALRHR